ncbi:nuclear transport factor 2 family protein [Chloroflexota bacterium]
MKTRFSILLTAVVMLLVLGATGCTTSTPQPTPTQPPPSIPTPQPTTTLKPNAAIVLGTAERHNAGDLEGMMEYWSDDAMWSLFGYPPTGTEIYTGKEQVQELFEENIANHSQWEVEIDSVVGDVVYAHSKNWHDFTRQIGVAPLEHSLVYEIKDGKIVKLSAYLTEDSTIRLKTALAEAMPAEQETESEEEAPVVQPVSELTVTFSGGTCSYDGPLALQAGEIQLTVDVQDQDRSAYAVIFFTLDPSKDFMDLMTATTGNGPDWAISSNYSEVGPRESETYSISVTEGPLYGVCWSKPPDLAIGGLGPFSVSPVPATATPPPPTPEIPESDIVVTFEKGKCTVDGPEIYPTGELTVTMYVKDLDKGNNALTFFNLEPGKDLHDLKAAQDSPSPPPWADMFSMQEALPGAIKTYTITVEAGPVYLLCWGQNPDRVIGSKGPIEVSP